MKAKFLGTMLIFAGIVVAVTLYFYSESKKISVEDSKSQQIVLANEIEQLIKLGRYEEAVTQTAELRKLTENTQVKEADRGYLMGMCLVSIILIVAVFMYIYFMVLRPFKKMEVFADEVARGNLDLPLKYERVNYFGKFTYAFDRMRNEIIRARACEREAVENNKTIIATISHDIKTPIASIRAYAEGLEANMDTSMEKRQKYCQVIMNKCDEVAKLTNDLFLHSVSDMDKIKIVNSEFEIGAFVAMAIEGISIENNYINFEKPDFKANVYCDKNRLMQIIENIINNSGKYAKTPIDINVLETDESIKLVFRDYGKGIPDEDMPFIWDKFYRGKNAGEEQGSGLGLYIVKYLTEKMNGEVAIENMAPGLKVTIILQKKKSLRTS